MNADVFLLTQKKYYYTFIMLLIIDYYLHDGVGVPMNGVVVIIGGGIKPWVELHFPAGGALSENIGMNNVRLPGDIAEELEVDLVMLVAGRR